MLILLTFYIFNYISKAAVQAHSHFTYNYTQLCGRCLLLSKHDSSSESGNALRICTIISEIH